MATKAFKEQKIAHIKDYAQKAKVAIVTNYKGLTVEEITLLRRELQKAGADYTVTKNTLAKIAMKDTDFAVLAPHDKCIKILPYDKDILTCEYIKHLDKPITINQTGRIKYEE